MNTKLPFILLLLMLLSSQHILGQKNSMERCPVCKVLKKDCRYQGDHPKCPDCNKPVDQCSYKGSHPRCSDCNKPVDKCRYKGKHPRCSDCGKLMENCPYGGNHPRCSVCEELLDDCPYGGVHPRCSTCGELMRDCPYQGDHPRCNTCNETIEQCPYKGEHPAPAPEGYDVTFSCNVSSAAVWVDGNQSGAVSDTLFLKTGRHTIKLTAKGYIDLMQDITVGADSTSFPFTMKKEAPPLPPEIQKLERDMVFVEGGTFTMGGTEEQGDNVPEEERRTHLVTISDFYVCKHEVTQAEWEIVMGSNPSFFKGRNLPVEQVSWEECREFIKRLNSATGKHYRLPTEAEWEYAARGGQKSQSSRYSGSDNAANAAWYDTNYTHDVMSKTPNELGLYDMSGNVCEWCSDWYDKDYYIKNYHPMPLKNPTGPSSGLSRVTRGGSWVTPAVECRVSARDDSRPDRRNKCIGFRLVRAKEEQ